MWIRPEEFPVTGDGHGLSLGSGGGCGCSLNVGLSLYRCEGIHRGDGPRSRSGHPHSQTAQHQPLTEQLSAGLHSLFGLSLLAFHLLVLDGVEMDLTYAVHHVFVLKCDEAEAPVSFGLLVHQHYGLFHFAKLTEVSFDLVGGRVLANAADEYLFGFVWLLGSVLGRGMLRVYFLAVQCVDRHFQHVVDARGFRERYKTESSASLQKKNIRFQLKNYIRNKIVFKFLHIEFLNLFFTFILQLQEYSTI